MVVDIQKTICGGINTANLINSVCFNKKIDRYHIFLSSFSLLRMF